MGCALGLPEGTGWSNRVTRTSTEENLRPYRRLDSNFTVCQMLWRVSDGDVHFVRLRIQSA